MCYSIFKFSVTYRHIHMFLLPTVQLHAFVWFSDTLLHAGSICPPELLKQILVKFRTHTYIKVQNDAYK